MSCCLVKKTEQHEYVVYYNDSVVQFCFEQFDLITSFMSVYIATLGIFPTYFSTITYLIINGPSITPDLS